MSLLRRHVTTADQCLGPRLRSMWTAHAGSADRAATTCSPFLALTLRKEEGPSHCAPVTTPLLTTCSHRRVSNMAVKLCRSARLAVKRCPGRKALSGTRSSTLSSNGTSCRRATAGTVCSSSIPTYRRGSTVALGWLQVPGPATPYHSSTDSGDDTRENQRAGISSSTKQMPSGAWGGTAALGLGAEWGQQRYGDSTMGL